MLNFFFKANKPVFFLKKNKSFFFLKKNKKNNSGFFFFNFLKKFKGLGKYTTIFTLSVFFIFFFKNTIFFKKFFFYFIKYNSFKKHKFLITKSFFFFKRFFFFLKKEQVGSAFFLKFKGRISAKGSSKKKQIGFKRGSFYDYGLKKEYVDYKPSSNKHGCVNLKMSLLIN